MRFSQRKIVGESHTARNLFSSSYCRFGLAVGSPMSVESVSVGTARRWRSPLSNSLRYPTFFSKVFYRNRNKIREKYPAVSRSEVEVSEVKEGSVTNLSGKRDLFYSFSSPYVGNGEKGLRASNRQFVGNTFRAMIGL